MLPPSKQKQIMRRDTGYSRFYAERSVLYILRHRILVAALASLASRCNQASLRLAKGWIAFTNGIFDSREPPIWVPVTARPQDSQPAIRTTPTFFYAPGFSSLRSLRSLHNITKPASGWQRVGLHSPMGYLTLGSPQSGSPSLLAPRFAFWLPPPRPRYGQMNGTGFCKFSYYELSPDPLFLE